MDASNFNTNPMGTIGCTCTVLTLTIALPSSQADASVKLKAALAEGEIFEALNGQMRANQASLKDSLAAEKQKTAEQSAAILDLKDQAQPRTSNPMT